MKRMSEATAPSGGPLEIGPTAVHFGRQEHMDVAWHALQSVFDPELCLDVVSLGLVYDIRDENGRVVIEMTLTTPGCPVSESLPEMARVAVSDAIGPSADVEVQVVWDPPWNPGMMDDGAASALGVRLR